MSNWFATSAREVPDSTAIVDVRRKLSWGELNDRVKRLTQAFGEAGLRPGDHIAMVMGNRSEFVEILTACIHAGITVTPVNWHLTGDEAAYVVRDCGARAFIADDTYLEVGEHCANLPGLRLRLVTGDRAHGSLDSYETVLRFSAPAPLPIGQEVGGFMLYTSGTTGRPKGVERSMGGSGSTVEASTSILAAMGRALGLASGGAHLVTGPLYHAAPLGFSQMAFNLGSSLILMDKWSPEATLDLMRDWSITSTHLVPTMFIRLLRLDEQTRASFDPSHLALVLHGAAPCPIWAKEQMIDWWGPIITEYYGATEGGATLITSEDWLAHKGSVGRPLPIYTVEIRDDDGLPQPPGQSGVIYFRSTLGETFRYHNDPMKTAAAHAEPGVFTLGDIGHVDAGGYVWLTDRKNDLIISGGVNIYPAEVELVLGAHPAVADVAVFGIPNDEWGEEVKAAIELLPGHLPSADLEAQLLAWCRERLAAYKCPRTFDFEERLPRHPTGKLYKRLLRDRYWQGRGRSI